MLLVSDPAAVELQKALAKADHIVQKAVDKAAAEEIKAEATGDNPGPELMTGMGDAAVAPPMPVVAGCVDYVVMDLSTAHRSSHSA